MCKTPLLFEGRIQGVAAFGAELQNVRLAAVCLREPGCAADATPFPVYEDDGKALFAPNKKDTWRAYAELAEREGSFVAVLDAPPTNLALALLEDKRLPERISRVALAGGAFFGGDASPCAEANFICDPEAAEIVLAAGLNPFILPLEAVERARAVSGDVPEGFPRAALALLLADGEEGFAVRPAWARVETKGRITRGKLVTDLFSDKKLEKNARVVTDIEPDALSRRLAAAFPRGY